MLNSAEINAAAVDSFSKASDVIDFEEYFRHGLTFLIPQHLCLGFK